MAHPLAKEALQLGPVAVDLLSVSGGRETRNVFAPRHIEYIRPLLSASIAHCPANQNCNSREIMQKLRADTAPRTALGLCSEKKAEV